MFICIDVNKRFIEENKSAREVGHTCELLRLAFDSVKCKCFDYLGIVVLVRYSQSQRQRATRTTPSP